MENSLQNGLIVTVIGIAIVFLGLSVLIGLIKVMTAVTNNMGQKKERKPKQAPAAVTQAAETKQTAVQNEPAAAEAAPQEDDGATVAAIMAAISCMMGSQNGFRVRHIRRM